MNNILIILAIVFLIIIVIGYLIGNFFYNLALNPKADKSSVLNAPHNAIEGGQSKLEEDKNNLRIWFENIEKESTYITSRDKLKLHAYRIKNTSNSNKWFVICHGYTGKASEMRDFAKKFYDMGYNLLLPDARGHGKSEGHYIGMGWHERIDVVDWINNIINIDNNSEIGLFGISMGGATVMMVSGEELPYNVKLIIEDCGYSSIWGEFAHQLKALYKLPAFPIVNFASIVSKFKAGYYLKEGDVLRQVRKSKVPMLFIHGDKDTFVPSYMINDVYGACSMNKEKLIIEDAGHGAASSANPKKYWDTVKIFLNKHFA